MDRRYQKDGSRVQVVLRSRDKGAMKSSFEKLRGNLSFSLFTKGTTYFSLLQSGDREEMHLEQELKVVTLPTVKRLKALLKKVTLLDLKAGVVLDFHMHD